MIQKVIDILNKNGYEAYAVGGMVRDELMGRAHKDFDVCTNALPGQVVSCFAQYKVIPTGIKHGTVTVIIDHVHIEITTFRIDGEYKDNRRPENVTFVSSLKEDLARRDFTINAMAKAGDTIYDYFGGQQDLKNKLIRCVGDPDMRFGEDALRILRALRFASTLDFNIDAQTEASIHKNAHLLSFIASERINAEFSKLLLGRGVKRVLAQYADVFCVFIPELRATLMCDQHNQYHIHDVYAHIVSCVGDAKKDLTIRLTMLLHDIAKPLCRTQSKNGRTHFYGHPQKGADMARNILNRLRYDKQTVSRVYTLVLYHDANIDDIKRMLRLIGAQALLDLVEVKKADAMGKSPKYLASTLKHLEDLQSKILDVLNSSACYSLSGLDIDGHDLARLGFKDRQIGQTLNRLLDLVIDGEIKNSKAELIAKAKQIVLKSQVK